MLGTRGASRKTFSRILRERIFPASSVEGEGSGMMDEFVSGESTSGVPTYAKRTFTGRTFARPTFLLRISQNANLTETILIEADLVWANLSYSRVWKAKLYG